VTIHIYDVLTLVLIIILIPAILLAKYVGKRVGNYLRPGKHRK